MLFALFVFCEIAKKVTQAKLAWPKNDFVMSLMLSLGVKNSGVGSALHLNSNFVRI